MPCRGKITRRTFLKTTAMGSAAGVLASCAGSEGGSRASKSTVFRVDECPVHDGQSRHAGVDSLFGLMAAGGLPLYRTSRAHPRGGRDGILSAEDIVLIKVNYLWRCRGITNTDVVGGVVQRVLDHPDGFAGEVVIVENSQGWGEGFGGTIGPDGLYAGDGELVGTVNVNAERPDLTSVSHLVGVVFAGRPVSSYWLDGVRSTFIGPNDHATDGYRILSDLQISYPCFTTAGGHRVELKEGIWNGRDHEDRLKLINIPVLKDHIDGTTDPSQGQTGITGAVKNCYGLVSMEDGWRGERHYEDSGTMPGRMYTQVKAPDLNILDCIWVSFESTRGYPPATTRRANVLLGGRDPVAIDFHAAKHILLPLGGVYAPYHDPESYDGLLTHLEGAMETINSLGGLFGRPVRLGDDSIEVMSARSQA